MSLSKKIKELRAEREWTQKDLAKRSGLNRSYVSWLEADKIGKPSADTFLKLAYAFHIPPEELYQAAGYIKEAKATYKETPEEILEKLKLAQPASIPIYSEFRAGEELTEPVDYIYRTRPRGAPKNIEGYLIHGHCLTEHGIRDGDIIIVDRDGAIDEGDIVACLTEEGMITGQLKSVAGELYLENSRGQTRFKDCQVASVVIEVIRRLK